MIKVKRVYEPLTKSDGRPILIDRLWPRGMAKERLKGVLWLKTLAPSEGLRKEFGHEPAKWEEFRKGYLKELKHNSQEVEKVLDEAKQGDVVLLYAAKDEQHNNAVVLKEYLEDRV